MSALVSYFAIIIGDLVPDDDPAWGLYLILVDILDIVTSPIITKDEIQYLRCSIKNHNDIYQQVFEEQLKSKHHLITHYPTCIEAMGPPRYYSSAKYESFHKNSKRYAHIVTSRTNIIYTLANKIQLQLAYRFYTKTGLKTTVQFGNKTETKSVYLGKRKLKVDEFSFIQINRTIYKPQYAILLSNDNQNNPVFGIIINIIQSEKNRIHFNMKKCSTIGFIDHIKAYQIVLPHTTEHEINYKLNLNSFVKPIKIDVTAEGFNVISRGDLS